MNTDERRSKRLIRVYVRSSVANYAFQSMAESDWQKNTAY
jgi:hypothetical protein